MSKKYSINLRQTLNSCCMKNKLALQNTSSVLLLLLLLNVFVNAPYVDVLSRVLIPGSRNPGLFFDPEIPGLYCSNPGISGFKK